MTCPEELEGCLASYSLSLFFERNELIEMPVIPFPFSNLTGTKQRPVVILSRDSINKLNLIVAKITSVIRNDQFSFIITPSNTINKLKKKSEVRTNEVFTVHKSLIKRKISAFKKQSLHQLSEKIKNHISVD